MKQISIELTDDEYTLLKNLCDLSREYLEDMPMTTSDPVYEIATKLSHKGFVDLRATHSWEHWACRLSSAGVFVMGWESTRKGVKAHSIDEY